MRAKYEEGSYVDVRVDSTPVAFVCCDGANSSGLGEWELCCDRNWRVGVGQLVQFIDSMARRIAPTACVPGDVILL